MDQHTPASRTPRTAELPQETLRTILASSRYFRAKDTGIGSLEVVSCQPLGADDWWVEVRADGAHYRMIVDRELSRDTLADADTATALVRDVGLLGEEESFFTPAVPPGAAARGMGVEQSNTSLIVDDAAQGDAVALKVFRLLEEGPNRDVETLAGLARVGSTVAPRLRAVWRDTAPGGAGAAARVTAYAQDLVPGARDAWEAVAEVDLGRLRRLTDQMHADLRAAFPTATHTGEEIADAFIARMPQIPALAPYRDAAIAFFDQVRDIERVPVQRIHGDYHLGQVLLSEDAAGEPALHVIDFEGEPARSISERNAPDSPLRDIAGMIRSLGYAGRDAHDFAAAEDTLLQAYVLDKALYEVAYELANRPDWAHIPLAAVEEIL
ncbi:hypothetical protein C1Y63_02575 [Corynebacterium sp. 13CS0277]|uniref:hypothetical protein n=1 Tax=Corynebacterium sp. 13CS0277 TaxID=2071994 RepID=UPI000D027195|nr:hypothetical protein [Corynebacterium sp. 13CS0277]PRQ12214.1 hypothetical protein C1Y63_02575 [Corynebacterium sp. 13CS0277]